MKNEIQIQHSIDAAARQLNYPKVFVYRLISMKLLKAEYNLKLRQLMITNASLQRFKTLQVKGYFRHVAKLPKQ